MKNSGKLTLSMLGELHARRVLHNDVADGEALLDELFEISPEIKQAYIATIFAEPGLGKSTLFKDLIVRNPPNILEDDEGKRKHTPVLVVSAEEGCTVRKLVDTMCAALGEPTTTSNTASYLKQKALTLLKEHGTVLLGIDEAQEFLNNSTRSGVKSVISFVRSLAESTQIPLVLMGTPSYENFVSASSDVNRRVKRSHTLNLMGSPIDDTTTFYWTVVGMMENFTQVTGRSLAPEFGMLEFSQRLFVITGGRIGCIYDFLAQYITDHTKSGSTDRHIGLADCLAVMKNYRPAFNLVKPAKLAFKLTDKQLEAVMEQHESMEA
jgi:hypothetical protein